MNIPIYRAKKIGSDEYVTGDLHIHKIEQVVGKRYIKETSYYILTHRKIDSNPNSFDGMYITDTMICTKIDPTTLAIHFEDMLDSQGNKIFASLQEDGKGGDIVISKSYPFYGDAPEITDSSGKCEELNYKGLLLFTSTGCYMDYIKVSDRVRGCAIGCAIEDFNEFKSIGIQE